MKLKLEQETAAQNAANEEYELLDENGELKPTIPGAWYTAPAKSKPWFPVGNDIQ